MAPSVVAARKEELDAIDCDFMTYDSRVLRFLWEKFPWVAARVPAYLTHRAGISIELLYLLTRGPRMGQQPHDLEAMLAEFRRFNASSSNNRFQTSSPNTRETECAEARSSNRDNMCPGGGTTESGWR